MEEITIEKQKANELISSTLDVTKNKALQNMWGLTDASVIQEVAKVAKTKSNTYGLFDTVPIICRGSGCAFAQTCSVSPANRVQGKRCPMEIGAILARYDQWCKHFNIDISQENLHESDITDASLVKDLVNIEIQMMRCENKIAIDGDFISSVIAEIDRKCNPYFEDDISKPSQFLMQLQTAKTKILNQLNATRKDKSQDRNQNASPTENAIKIFQQVQEAIKKNNIIDVDSINFDDVETPKTFNQDIEDELMKTVTEPPKEEIVSEEPIAKPSLDDLDNIVF